MKTVAVIGAGLSGSMIAIFLRKLGYNIVIFEKRPNFNTDNSDSISSEFGTSTSATRRSINLALSHRGMAALDEVHLLNEVMDQAIRMPKRIIHLDDGKIIYQPYGKSTEAIFSVGRQSLNCLLLHEISKFEYANFGGTFRVYYDYTLIDVNRDGKCTFRKQDGSIECFEFDFVFGADGAYSVTRDCMLKRSRINFSREYIIHGYKELTIPAIWENDEAKYAMEDYHGLHIWPRGKFMLIALPNPDKTFTATLFSPYITAPNEEGMNWIKNLYLDSHIIHPLVGGFDSIDGNEPNAITSFFKRYFPDAAKLMPNVVEDYQTNPVGSLLTVRVSPWNQGKILLLGDAAHAVVPFYGQVSYDIIC
jgi:kynurenine 3-monooxygenase